MSTLRYNSSWSPDDNCSLEADQQQQQPVEMTTNLTNLPNRREYDQVQRPLLLCRFTVLLRFGFV